MLLIEELAERRNLSIAWNGRRQPDSKALRASALDTLPCTQPCSRPTVEIVPFGRGAVQADLKDNAIPGQRPQTLNSRAREEHSVGEYGCRCCRSTSQENLADIWKQKRFAASHENFFDA
jgi:hypothetical protein